MKLHGIPKNTEYESYTDAYLLIEDIRKEYKIKESENKELIGRFEELNSQNC